jgi:hypothetical protein
MPLDRKEFLEKSAAALAALGFAPALPPLDRLGAPGAPTSGEVRSASRAGRAGPPDLVVYARRVITMDPALPAAEAFAIKDGRFVAIGRRDEIRALAGRGSQVIDTRDAIVVPGFIDAHSHPSGAGLGFLRDVDTNLSSVARIVAAIRERAAKTPKGEWIIGFMYDDTRLAEGRPVNRKDLDAATTDHPVALNHRGGHTSVYNSLAFTLAGITAATPDPQHGAIYKEGGELTGRVAEAARGPIQRLIRNPSTREDRQKGVALISKMMSAAGLTSVHQTGTSSADYVAYRDALEAGELRFRAYLFARGGSYDSLSAGGVRTGYGDEFVKIGGAKFAADGSASERTMAMSTAYVGRPADFGILTMTAEEVHAAVEKAHRAGWQIGIHANGDLAITMVLDAYERVQKLWPRADARHRIEHCSLVNPEILRRIKAGGVIPTPFYTYAHYHGNKWVEYGPEKMEWMFAHKRFLDAGIIAGPASDFTPGPFEPLMAIQSMVTRKDTEGRVWGPSQRITVDQALRVCTVNGAYCSFEEKAKGSITDGKLGDFAILEKDPHDVDPDHIKEIRVLRTVMGGKTTHEG